jgi:hypothetical protein
MKIAVMIFILTAVMSISSYAGGSFYNAVAAYGAGQEDGLKGVIVLIGKRGKQIT